MFLRVLFKTYLLSAIGSAIECNQKIQFGDLKKLFFQNKMKNQKKTFQGTQQQKNEIKRLILEGNETFH